VAWIEISVSVRREAVAPAEQALEDAGALAITLEDNMDDPVLEPAAGSTPLWPSVRMRGMFEAGVDRDTVLRALQMTAGMDRPDMVEWRSVPDQDWARVWMERFRPMKFGDRLWIVPSGMEIPHDPQNIEIRLDPGLAFGTGTHPTTALCLEWLDAHDPRGLQVVDYGCGSGVLGIAAALKGAVAVVCVDNDPQALEATAANAARNGVLDRMTCQTPEDFSVRNADLVLANILAGPLISLREVLAGCLKPGCPLILSGLLEEQGEEVTEAYGSLCGLAGSANRGGWLRLDLERS
jgi:ribosomal protein L11 methyltransferase